MKFDCRGNRVRNRIVLVEKKTGKAKTIALNKDVVRAAAEALEFPCRVSCHSLRKTFGYHAWKNGASPAVIMEVHNHSSFAVTRRHLGVSQDDKDAVCMRLAFSA
jgi:integrase